MRREPASRSASSHPRRDPEAIFFLPTGCGSIGIGDANHSALHGVAVYHNSHVAVVRECRVLIKIRIAALDGARLGPSTACYHVNYIILNETLARLVVPP